MHCKLFRSLCSLLLVQLSCSVERRLKPFQRNSELLKVTNYISYNDVSLLLSKILQQRVLTGLYDRINMCVRVLVIASMFVCVSTNDFE